MQALYIRYTPPIRDPETMKMRYKEMLDIYIFKNPTTDEQHYYNKELLSKAEAIVSQRIISLINEEFGFLDKYKMEQDFLEYYLKIAKTKHSKWIMVYKHFHHFVHGKCQFKDVTVDLCRRFREYLLKDAPQMRHGSQRLSHNSAAGYFSTFRAMLKVAYRDKRIKDNVNEYLEKVKWKDTKKEFLTLDEIKRLAATECEIPVLKSASIFACLTGLRLSDILQLTWENIVPMPGENGYCMRIRTQKTDSEETLPLSEESLEYCGERSTGLVFKGFQRVMAYVPLHKWVKQAGITKHITFHCFRHTFATQQIANNVDIYTVSKMLTHRHVSTTEIYAKMVNEKKIESANKITLK
ncbi:MAG: site-specific integrase [Rikenellaceae bacterium]